MMRSVRLSLAQWISHILSPPYMALTTLILAAFSRPILIQTPSYRRDLIVSVLLLTVIPAIAGQDSFFLQRLSLNHRRKIAFFSFLFCYVLLAAYCYLRGTHPLLAAISLSYLLTITCLLIANCFFRASGHASGVAGPIILFHLLFHWWALLSLPIIPLLAWARLVSHEHNLGQVLAGFTISLLSTWGTFVLFGL